MSISTPNAQGDSFIFKHSFSAPQEQNSVTTTSIIAEGTQLHDLVTLGSSLWLVGSIGEAGVLWTLGEGQEDIELTPQAEAPYGVFIAITSFADELFLLERSPGSGAWIHRVFRFDSGSMVLEQVGSPHVSSVGCDDLAVFYDPYSEILKPTLACGNNGGEIAIWDESLNTWSRTTNVGNSARIEASPNGETGFFIQWSGRKVTPIQVGAQPGDSSESTGFATRGIYGGAYSPGGYRALIVGRSSNGQASVLAWSTDEPSCTDYQRCPWIDVSFSGFDAAPYNASTNTYLMDVAWASNGRWGVIVGGESSYNVNRGLLMRFSLDP